MNNSLITFNNILQQLGLFRLLKSRKFWLSLIELLFMVGVAVNPDLEVHANSLIAASMIVVGLAIKGFADEDKVKAGLSTGPTEFKANLYKDNPGA